MSSLIPKPFGSYRTVDYGNKHLITSRPGSDGERDMAEMFRIGPKFPQIYSFSIDPFVCEFLYKVLSAGLNVLG
jgi:hypothetical protein